MVISRNLVEATSVMNQKETFKVVKIVEDVRRKYTSAVYTTGVFYYLRKLTTAPKWALDKGFGITSFVDLDLAQDFKNANNCYGPHKIFRCVAIDVLEKPSSVRLFPMDMVISRTVLTSKTPYLFSDPPEDWPHGTVISTHILLLEETK